MLNANKSKLFEKIFAVYNTNLLKRRFQNFSVKGLNNLKNRKTLLPSIIYVNHSSWWDGLVAFQISYQTNLESYIMMEEKQLTRFFLFRKLGAFSVVRENPRQAMKSLKYAVKLLKNSNRTLWIFPQGEILPNDTRPLNFYPGISKIVKKTGNCSTISMSMRYEFLNDEKPEIFVNIKAAEIFINSNNENKNSLTAYFEQNTAENLDEMKNDILMRRFDEYEKVI